MSKKLMSVLLVAVLVLSMGTVAMASVSAEELPAKADGMNRYYFYMPYDLWVDGNDYTETAGIYWWEGDGAPGAWPGTAANPTSVDGVYYYDVAQNVTTIIWNNFVDGGTDTTAEVYAKAYQTKNIGCEYYDAGESANYPDGTDSFDEMIYVLDLSKTDVEPFSGKSTFAGEWFYYYGNGEYGYTPEKGDVYFNQRSYMEAPTPVGNTDVTTPSEPAADDELKDGFALIENPSSQEGISEVKVGDTVTYSFHVATAPGASTYVEDFQGFVTYNAEYLEVLSATSGAAVGAVINKGEAGTVYFNATEVNTGMNIHENSIITIEFKVLDAAEGQTIALPEWTMEEMTEFNGDSIFTDSQLVQDGAKGFVSMLVPTYEDEQPTTVAPTTAAPATTNAPATTVAGTDATSGKDDNTSDKDPVPTGSNVAIFAVLAVLAMAGAAVVVLRKKVNA